MKRMICDVNAFKAGWGIIISWLTFETELRHDDFAGNWPVGVDGVDKAHVGGLSNGEAYCMKKTKPRLVTCFRKARMEQAETYRSRDLASAPSSVDDC